jgi:hypothetical protein
MNMIPSAETVESLKSKHREVWMLRRGERGYVLRCPEAAEYRRYLSTVADDRKMLFDAQDRLARHAVVFPEPAELGTILELRPGLVPWLADAAANIAADMDEIEAKKA